jgi:hypothetical protein
MKRNGQHGVIWPISKAAQRMRCSDTSRMRKGAASGVDTAFENTEMQTPLTMPEP